MPITQCKDKNKVCVSQNKDCIYSANVLIPINNVLIPSESEASAMSNPDFDDGLTELSWSLSKGKFAFIGRNTKVPAKFFTPLSMIIK